MVERTVTGWSNAPFDGEFGDGSAPEKAGQARHPARLV